MVFDKQITVPERTYTISTRRVIITGSREFTDVEQIAFGILHKLDKRQHTTFIHGGARGADSLADQFIDEHISIGFFQISKEVYPVLSSDWDAFGKRAGIMRNEYMLSLGADLVLAFYKTGAANRGTSHMVSIAEAAGVEVVKFYE